MSTKRFFMPDDYKNFKTWDEMVYIQTMIANNANNISKNEMRDFVENFPKRVDELKRTDSKFSSDYKDYLQIKNNPQFITSPQTDKELKINKMLLTLNNINLACKTFNLNNETTMKKQRMLQLKYENRFKAYRKENNQKNKDITILKIKKTPKEI